MYGTQPVTNDVTLYRGNIILGHICRHVFPKESLPRGHHNQMHHVQYDGGIDKNYTLKEICIDPYPPRISTSNLPKLTCMP